MVKRNTRRVNRKNRRSNRRANTRRLTGGYLSPASTGANPMDNVMKQSLAQGNQFAQAHLSQHGGEHGAFPMAVSEQSILPQALHASARVTPIDQANAEIIGLKDQGGGRRPRKSSKKSTRKTSRKGRKASRKVRRGGAYHLSEATPFNAPSMLLSNGQEAKALAGMNAEWKLAENPSAFAPGLSR